MIAWAKRHVPTRETIAANRWLAPFADRLLRPDLWRFTRRSVPRGVALGLFVAPIVPVAHTVVAALLAVPLRANVVVAAASTWVINPLTIPVFYVLAYRLGRRLVGIGPVSEAGPVFEQAGHHWLALAAAASGRAALGTLILASAMASVGYLIAVLGWRLRIGRRWQRRRALG